MRGFKLGLLALALVASVPMAAFAQATLSGLVRDTSGAVLPGATVEASSPVLIEKVRSGVTDGTGRYTIPDLRPGTYKLTFSLTGFKTVVRDAVELSGTAVLTVNADLEVGGVQETITVSGLTPAVDLQSTTRQAVMDQEIVSAVPSSRTPFTVGVLIPGVKKGAFTGQDVGGSVVQEVASLEANGGRTSDQRMMVNGVALSSGIAGGWGGGAVPNATGTAEFAIDVSAVDAQAATGGDRGRRARGPAHARRRADPAVRHRVRRTPVPTTVGSPGTPARARRSRCVAPAQVDQVDSGSNGGLAPAGRRGGVVSVKSVLTDFTSSSIGSRRCLRTKFFGFRSCSSRSAYSGPSSLRRSFCALVTI